MTRTNGWQTGSGPIRAVPPPALVAIPLLALWLLGRDPTVGESHGGGARPWRGQGATMTMATTVDMATAGRHTDKGMWTKCPWWWLQMGADNGRGRVLDGDTVEDNDNRLRSWRASLINNGDNQAVGITRGNNDGTRVYHGNETSWPRKINITIHSKCIETCSHHSFIIYSAMCTLFTENKMTWLPHQIRL